MNNLIMKQYDKKVITMAENLEHHQGAVEQCASVRRGRKGLLGASPEPATSGATSSEMSQ